MEQRYSGMPRFKVLNYAQIQFSLRLQRHLFYFESSGNLTDVIYTANSSNPVWQQGTLKDSLATNAGVDWTYLDATSVALAACYVPSADYGNPAIKAYVGVKDTTGSNRLQEIGVVNASTPQAQAWNSWNFFPNTNDLGGVACAVHDDTMQNLYFLNTTSNQISQMSYNYEQGTSFTQYWTTGQLIAESKSFSKTTN
jgi:hypothetical protein